MTTRKTLEEYQTQEIARAVFDQLSADFVRRGEYDVYVNSNTNALSAIIKDVGVLQRDKEDHIKDKKTYKLQFAGIGFGFLVQFIIWAIIASNGFKIGG